jgi:GMP synthase (glutamine-hydrolysing)
LLKRYARMRILVIQHDGDKGLGVFTQSLVDASLELDVQFAGHGELALSDHAAVIALPGVANPDDDTLAIHSTLAVLGEALLQGLPVLGICLGAELLAEAAGAGTHPCPPEWGYREVALLPAAREDDLLRDLPEVFEVFQAHTFACELPAGAVALAGDEDGLQAFRVGTSAWGLQFHPEPTLAMLEGWTHALGHLMQASGVDPATVREHGRLRVPEWTERAAAMGRRFAAAVQG